MDLSQYELEILHHDGEFILYRGHSKQAGAPSVLLLAPVSLRPALETLKKIEHEYSFRNELDPTWAVRPLALSQYNEQRVLVLENPGGEPLNRLIQGPMEMRQFLRFTIGLATALTQLHKRELIHKDVKPANVLVDSAIGQVWLTGFGIASRLPRERQSPQPPEFIAGTLPYMAPEQTGRMNRSIDSRCDLYALGVTLYEMLTGSPPFSATDPMELVHCHVARQPVAPIERLNGIPGPVSAIVMKLLAKTAEERYQTATGAASDLRRCLAGWERHHHIDKFPLGEHDTPDRLLIPEKLYGRALEVNALLASFDRIVAGGRPELVLVSGYSGIGKSSVVNELHRPLVPPRGLFASGKFDQYKRDIPYATLAQAFKSLLRSVLTKNEAELSKWRDALREAVGPNGQLIVDLVPELKLIIGEQPPVPELPPQAAQGRFQLVLRRFISVFARPEHPLALFLDDLQWLDTATLDFMEDLLSRSDMQHLMLIGAYRNNEVNPSHPLMRKLEAMRQPGAILQDIVLAPLTREDLAHLIADSLHCEPERATPLAQLIHDKTAGNPFFAIQFFSALAEEGLLTFDHGEGRWSWDLNRVYAKGHTDNVVDLMVGKLNRLPVETQKALQQLACLGNSAEFAMLQMVYQDSNNEMHAQLWEAVRTGLIFRSEDSYRFLHDRVQEAAYSLIPQELRAEAHLRIGKLLAAHTPSEKLEEGIFEIVNQLNRGSHLITSGEDRKRVAELNFIAGRRAKASTAYASALKYLTAGRALLTQETWEDHYELIFSIEYLMAECELLTADTVAAEDRLSMLAQRARSAHHTAIVARLRLALYQTMDRSDRAVEVCLEYLRRGGNDWSPRPTSDDARREYDRIWSQLGNRQIEDLVDLPLMTNPEVLDALDVLTEVVAPALLCDENLSSQVICRTVNLSLEHGNTDGSCFAYVWLAIIAGPCFGNYSDGFRFGRLGYELVEKRGLTRYQARTFMCFGSIVMPWAKHAREGRDLVRRAFDAANRVGDLTFAAYSCNQLVTNLLTVGDPLAEVQPEAETGLAFAEKARFGLVVDVIIAQLGLIRTLRGLTQTFGSFNAQGFDELQFEQHLASNPTLALSEFWYLARKVQARCLAGDYASAVKASLRAQQLLWTSPSQFETAEFRFYGALSHAASWDFAPPEQRQLHSQALIAHQKHLEVWAENCPENFENRSALVGGEIARIEGRELDAMRLYEKAIRSAHANAFVHNEAVAYEFAARFYAARGLATIADTYLRNARPCYLRWGADGKVRQLDQMHPYLREEPASPRSTTTIGTSVEQLDLATVVKVSQAMSGEIVLENLIEKLMMIALEHAGAERGLLILPRGDELRIEAEATTGRDTVEVHLRQTVATPSELPKSMLHFVIRAQEIVVLDDASSPNQFSSDEYIRQQRSRAVLCLPLVKQSKLIGVLYLENNLTPHVFTPARMAVLKLLASQAAISLENARLYTEVQQTEAYLEAAQRLSHTGSFGWCPASGEIVWSEETFRIFEYDRATKPTVELVLQRVHPEDRTLVEQLIDRASRDAKDFDLEYRLLVPPGSVKHLHVVAHAARDESGKVEFVGSVMDITESKRAEERLRQDEMELRQLIDIVPQHIFMLEPDGRFLYANRRDLEYTGLTLDDILAPDLLAAIYHPDDLERLRDEREHAIARGIAWESEARILGKDGQYRWFLVRLTPLRDEQGRIIRWYGTRTDIEDRKQAEEIRTAQARQTGVRADVSAALSKTAHPGEILQGAAEAIVRHLDAAFARIWTLNQERNILELQASAGLYTHLDGPHSRIPVGKLKLGVIAQNKKPYMTNDVLNDPWVTDKVWAQKEGMISFAGYPLVVRDRVVGVMAMFARQRLSAATREALASVADSIAQGVERNQTEEKIRQSEAHLAEAQRLSHTGSFVWKISTGDILWSEESFRMFQYDWTVKPTMELVLQRVHPEDVALVKQIIERVSQGGNDDFEFEHRLLMPDGAVKHVHVIAHAVRDKSGNLECVGSAMDVTEQRQARDALEKASAYCRHDPCAGVVHAARRRRRSPQSTLA